MIRRVRKGLWAKPWKQGGSQRTVVGYEAVKTGEGSQMSPRARLGADWAAAAPWEGEPHLDTVDCCQILLLIKNSQKSGFLRGSY